jgi:hypothetical protein
VEGELVEGGLEVVAGEEGLVLVRREVVLAHRFAEVGEDAVVVDGDAHAGLALRRAARLAILERHANAVVDGNHARAVAGDEGRARRAGVGDPPAIVLRVGFAYGALGQEDAWHKRQEAADQEHAVGLHAREVGAVLAQVAGEREQSLVENDEHLVVCLHPHAVRDGVEQLLVRVVRARCREDGRGVQAGRSWEVALYEALRVGGEVPEQPAGLRD